eukprot:637526-Pyramimonas_sp.AAC.2
MATGRRTPGPNTEQSSFDPQSSRSVADEDDERIEQALRAKETSTEHWFAGKHALCECKAVGLDYSFVF